MQGMVERVVYAESAEDAMAALRVRGMNRLDAERLVHEALVADGQGAGFEAGAVYSLYALAAVVAAAVSTALIALH